MIRRVQGFARQFVAWRPTVVVLGAAAIALTACGGQPTPSSTQTADAGPSLALPTVGPSSLTVSPVPSPQGRLVFERFVGDDGSVLTMDSDGADAKLLLRAVASPRWSPDGRHISVVANNRQGRLYFGLVDPNGTNYVQFDSPDPTLDLACFAWSPDGSRLACEGWDDTDLTRNGIYSVRASDGLDLVRVTSSPDGGHDIPSDYSPDGRRIVFTRQSGTDEANVALMVVGANGGDAREMTDRKIAGGRWSPDGETILTDANGSLLLVPTNGGDIQPVRIASEDNLNPTGAAWSPDGAWIVFSGHSSTGFDLNIVRTDGTIRRQVTDTRDIWEGGVDWR